jgi:antitoxin component YwqK of YwqJK toxin-antitoxin module
MKKMLALFLSFLLLNILIFANWDGKDDYKKLDIMTLKGQQKFEKLIRAATNGLIKAMPPERQKQIMEDMNGSLMPQVYVGQDVNDPCYVPFWDLPLGLYKRKIFMFNPRHNRDNVAHEVGHFYHHALLGRGYASFALWPRGSGHSLGSKGAENNIVEEPAYLSQYYLTGYISTSAWNPEQGDFLLENRETGYKNSPEKDNFLDIEGFGIALMASMIRTKSTMTDYKGRTVDVPVFAPGIDREQIFQEMWKIIAVGMSSIRELRNALVSLATTKKWSSTDVLSALWQPMGYSYHMRCRFVDKDKKPLSGITAQSFVKVDGKDYVLPETKTASDGNGDYKLEEVYPWVSSLRVSYLKDGKQEQKDLINVVKIGWYPPTNEEVNLGDIELDAAPEGISHYEEYYGEDPKKGKSEEFDFYLSPPEKYFAKAAQFMGRPPTDEEKREGADYYSRMIASLDYEQLQKSLMKLAGGDKSKADQLLERIVQSELWIIYHGSYIRYNPDGKKDYQRKFADGLVQGEHIKYHDNGQIKEKGLFVNNLQQGEWQEFDASERLIKTTFFEKGQPIWTYSQAYYSDGKLSSDGPKMMRGTNSTYPDVKDGPFVEYYENGQARSRGQYKQNQQAGTWEEWNKDGRLIEKLVYSDPPDPDKNVHLTSYDSEGRVEEEGYYDNRSQKHGTWTETRGKDSYTVEYEHGREKKRWRN